MGPAFGKTGSIWSVSAHAGRVLVGGSGLHRLRAGDQRWQYRELPDGVDVVRKAAQEPWAPWRQAVATDEGVAIFVEKEGDGRVAHVRPADGSTYVTSLAWGRAGERSALFVLWEDGEVARLYPERGDQDVLDLPPMAALASDSNGSMAMLAWEELSVFVTDGSERIQFRRIEFPKDWYDALPEQLDEPFHLAVAGKQVALSVGWEGAFVSRDIETMPFVKSEPLSLAGALAFEGTSPDAALFGAVHTESFASIVRVDASGNAMRLGDLRPERGRAVPFDELAWDATRRRLFAVHRQAGLVVATAPDAKGGKLAAPN
jgi:hypothetical protein